jgi:GAF domain-containing protein
MFSPSLGNAVKKTTKFRQSATVALAEQQRKLLAQKRHKVELERQAQTQRMGKAKGMFPDLDLNTLRQPMKENDRNRQSEDPLVSLDPPSVVNRDQAVPQFARVPDDPTILEALFRTEGLVRAIDKSKTYAELLQALRTICLHIIQVSKVQLTNLYVASPLWNLLLCIVSETAGDSKQRSGSISSSSSSSSSNLHRRSSKQQQARNGRKNFEGLKLSDSQGICGYVCKHEKAVLLDSHVASDWRYDRVSDDRSGYSNRSLLIVPVKNVQGKIVAVLETRNSLRVGGFSEQDELFISSNCEYIALIFSKLFFLVEKHELFKRNYAQKLLALTDTMTPTVGAHEVMENLINCMSVNVQCELIQIWIPCPELQEAVLTCAQGLKEHRANPFKAKQVGTRVPYGGVLVGRAALLGHSFVVNDVPSESRLRKVLGATDEASVMQTTAAESYWGALELAGLEEVRNIMVVPLANKKGEIVVILECLNCLDSEVGMAANFDTRLKTGDYLRPAPFKQEDKDNCLAMQDAAVAAIQRVGRSITIKAEKKRYNALLKIVEHVNSEEDFGRVMKKVIGLAYDLLPADQISLSLIRTYAAQDGKRAAAAAVAIDASGGLAEDDQSPSPSDAHLVNALELSGIVNVNMGRRGSMQMDENATEQFQNNLQTKITPRQRPRIHSGRGKARTIPNSAQLQPQASGYSIIRELVPFVAKESRLLSFVFPVSSKRTIDKAVVQPAKNQRSSTNTRSHSRRASFGSVVHSRRPSLEHNTHTRSPSMDLNPEDLAAALAVAAPVEEETEFLNGGLMAHAAFTQQPVVVADAAAHPHHNGTVDGELQYTTKSMMAFPIACNGQCVGVVAGVNRGVFFPYLDLRVTRCPVTGTLANFTKFTVQDSVYMNSVAQAIASIFTKLDSKRRLAVHERILNAVLGLLKLSDDNLVNETGEEGLMRKVHTIIGVTYEALSADRVTLYFVENKEVFTVASKDIKGIRFPVGKGITGTVAVTGEAEMLEDCYLDPRFKRNFDRKTNYRTKSMLVMPIKDAAGNVIAVLQALNKLDVSSFTNTIGGVVQTSRRNKAKMKKDFNLDAVVSFDEDDREILRAICQQVSDTLRKSIYHATQKNLQASLRNEDQVDVFSLVGTFTDMPVRRQMANLDHNIAEFVDAHEEEEEDEEAGQPEVLQQIEENQRHVEEEGGEVAKWPKHVTLLDLPDIDDPLFNPYDYDLDTLTVITFSIFRNLNVFKTMPVAQKTVKNFVLQVRKNYKENWFHNFYHGFSVMHFASIMATRTDIRKQCGRETTLTMLIAALCHDLDHPGNNNSFEINTESELATLHNDISVLENHHCHQTMLLLRKEGCNVMENFSKASQRTMKTDIITGIMGTDMTKHMDALQGLNLCANLATVAEDLKLLMCMVIHTADLSGQAFPRATALEWERRISREFAEQAKSEKELDLPSLPFMTDLHIPQRRGLLQTQFFDFVLIPWWNRLLALLPELSQYFDNIMKNRRFYNSIARGVVEAESLDEFAYEIKYGPYDSELSESELEEDMGHILDESTVYGDDELVSEDARTLAPSVTPAMAPQMSSPAPQPASVVPVPEEPDMSELRRRRRATSKQKREQKESRSSLSLNIARQTM